MYQSRILTVQPSTYHTSKLLWSWGRGGGGGGGGLIRGWALINFSYLRGGRLFEVGISQQNAIHLRLQIRLQL